MLTSIRNIKSAAVRIAAATLTCVLAATGLTPAANAQSILVDNGPFVNTSSWNITNFALADDFNISAPVSVSNIRFWAMDYSEGRNFDSFSGTMSWFIHANSVENRPGSVVASGFSSAVSVNDTGIAYSGTQCRIFQVDIPVNDLTLDSGTFWLRLKEGNPSEPGDSSAIQWMVRDGHDSQAFRFDRNSVTPTAWDSDGGTTDLAFQLMGPSGIESFETPEPSSLALFLMVSLLIMVMICPRMYKVKTTI